MYKFLFLLLFVLSYISPNAQGIGELAPDPPPITFPPNTLGMDVMFCEGGVGLGGFYRKEVTPTLTLTTDFSISEAKDETEVTYYDYFGQPVVYGKKNRLFLVPLTVGAQYRLFSEEITENLRPYINAGVGPSIVVITPFEREFFNSFKYAQMKVTLGGYIGFGANFGLNKSSLLGVNLRYYIIHFFDDGIEGLQNRYQKNLGGIYLTINIGTMF